MANAYRCLVFALRYFPNLVTGEFLNVGVAVSCPDVGWWNVRLAKKLKGMSRVFPSAQPDALASSLTRIAAAIDAEQGKQRLRLQFDVGPKHPLDPVMNIIGNLNGSLRWADEPISAVTKDLKAEVDYWYTELVHVAMDSQEEAAAHEPFADDLKDLLRHELSNRGILSRLHPSEVGSYHKESFDLTYTNGRTHIFETLRLNYFRPGSIRSHAQQWRGKLDSLNDGVERRFAFYALADMPTTPDLFDEARIGIIMIENANAHEVRVVPADRVHELGEIASRVVG